MKQINLRRFRPLLTRAQLRRARNALINFLRRLDHVPSSAYVHPTASVSRDLKCGAYAFIAEHCVIGPGVEVGCYSMLAAQTAIVGDDHVWDIPGIPIQFSGRPVQHRTVICDDVWIGFGVVILRGVTIGRGAIVAARSVVTRDVDPYSIVAGIPARRISERFKNEDEILLHDNMLNGSLVSPRFAGKQIVSKMPTME